MKQGVLVAEIGELIEARLWLAHVQLWLWRARVQRQSMPFLNALENEVYKALDRLWEAQQRAGGAA